MKECICTKAHFKVPDGKIRIKKLLTEKQVISNQRVYFRKGSVHIITENTKGVDFYSYATIDGLFKYENNNLNSQFNKYFTDDEKFIRKSKLRKLLKFKDE